MAFVLLLLIMGFPAAIVLAWTFDLTWKGIVRTPPRDDQLESREEMEQPSKGLAGNRALIAIILLVVIIGIAGGLTSFILLKQSLFPSEIGF